ncbi:MAG: menaquinone-dependent protoporphyrinogen IX dehydrogenase [Betaproteobacteria bacterium]|nr:menaquinone-dependent protoporphyrinogen IX dehydrogenase [Betaproteobacteria bacterium]
MSHVLIAYSTVDGQTQLICERIRQILEAADCSVASIRIGRDTVDDLAAFDLVVIGASIRYGKHRPDVLRFIEANRAVLDQRPSAFFSVNVVARKAGKDTPGTNPYVRAFRRKTTWAPAEVAVFAGKIDYPKYGFMDRQVIRLIMWITKGPTDPASCTEFTDWQAVDRFAHRLIALCTAAAGLD